MKQSPEVSGDKALSFLPTNQRKIKPRSHGITEISGPYYSPMGSRYLADLFETMGTYVDSLKFAAGSFTHFSEVELQKIIRLCHEHHVLVSRGRFIEYVVMRGRVYGPKYLEGCPRFGFYIVEISSGFITLPFDDWLRLVEQTQKAGLKEKPEVEIQFEAGGATSAEELEAQGTRDPACVTQLAKRFIDAGAYMIVIESEGITESVKAWCTDVPARIVSGLGLEKVMFEAADPPVFSWYVKNYGPDINLFMDHSQIVQLECLRSGIWGTADTWGDCQLQAALMQTGAFPATFKEV